MPHLAVSRASRRSSQLGTVVTILEFLTINGAAFTVALVAQLGQLPILGINAAQESKRCRWDEGSST